VSARTVRTPPAAFDAFIEALAEGETVTAACRVADLGRRTVYDERGRNEDFARAWEDAIEAGTDSLEAEARRRALDGSDRLLEFLLKARRPDVYRERVSIDQHLQVKQLTSADLARARALGEDPEIVEAAEKVGRRYAEMEEAARGE
jgi:hypothetical protein